MVGPCILGALCVLLLSNPAVAEEVCVAVDDQGSCASSSSDEEPTALVQHTIHHASADDITRQKHMAPSATIVQMEVMMPHTKTKGTVEFEIHPEWAPKSAEHFLDIMKDGRNAIIGNRFYSVSDSTVKFGLPLRKSIRQDWLDRWGKPDRAMPGGQKNKRGTLAFLLTMNDDPITKKKFPNLIETKLAFSTKDNADLDAKGSVPFAKVTKGMDIVDAIYNGYGTEVDEFKMIKNGLLYLERQYPQLTYVDDLHWKGDVSDKKLPMTPQALHAMGYQDIHSAHEVKKIQAKVSEKLEETGVRSGASAGAQLTVVMVIAPVLALIRAAM